MNVIVRTTGRARNKDGAAAPSPAGSGEETLLKGTGVKSDVVRRVRRRKRRFALITAILMVFLPTVLAGIYYGFYASDIYVAETRFMIRSRQTVNVGKLSILSSIARPAFSADSQTIIDYIHSNDLILELEKALPLREIFSKGDWLASVTPGLPLEEFRKYWRKMVHARYDGKSEGIVLTVRTFTPEDSYRLIREILARSEALVNRISAKARQQALRFAEEDVRKAENRLMQVLNEIRKLRTKTGILDPKSSITNTAKMEGQIIAELSQLKVQFETRRKLLGANAPGMEALRSRIRALQKELDALRKQRLTRLEEGELPKVLERFERLKVEASFAEKAYVNALVALDAARARANRDARYLAIFVNPVMPDSPLEPKRVHMVLIVLVLSFFAWAIFNLIVLGIRDHIF